MVNPSLDSTFHYTPWFTIGTGISPPFGPFRFRDAHLVLDHEAVRTRSKGYGRSLQVHSSELVMPETVTFPLFEAQVSKLLLFKPGAEMKSFETREALPFEGNARKPLVRRRRSYVTLERAKRLGKTPGCKGCAKLAEEQQCQCPLCSMTQLNV